jgi:WD40 repeat protein
MIIPMIDIFDHDRRRELP